MKGPGVSRSASPLLAVLRQRNYGRYAIGNVLSLIGTWMQRVGVGWLAWELTGSGTFLGLIAVADLAPALLLGPLGGAIADRIAPVRITLVCQVLAMICAALLCLATWLGMTTPTLLFALVLAHGMVMGFTQPARLALVYALVNREHLPTAVAVNSVAFNSARFIGPALAGAALVFSGPALVFGINTLSFIAFIIALATLDLPRVSTGGGRREASLMSDMLAGARYAAGHRFIGPLLLFAGFFSIGVRSHVELLPGFAGAVLGGGAAELATLSSAVGLGAILSGLWLASRGAAFATARFVVACTALAAFGVIGFATSSTLLPASLYITVAGAGMVLAGITIQTLLQLSVEAHMRARVMSFYGLVFRAGPALGALIMGIASDRVGLQWPIGIGAVMSLLVGFGFWRRAGRMDLERAGEQRRAAETEAARRPGDG